MDKFLDKFGLYDIFSMLIPGLVFMTLLLYLCPGLVEWRGEAYSDDTSSAFLFFVLSYLFGLLFHEFWRILDFIKTKLFKWKEKRKRYTNPKEKIIDNVYDQEIIQRIENHILKDFKLKNKDVDVGDKSAFIFNYCMNELEIEGLAGKEEKMQVISEMSASLLLASLALEIVYIGSVYCEKAEWNPANFSVLLISIIFFLIRKNRYENYRINNLMRTYYIMIKKSCIKESQRSSNSKR